MIELAKDTIDKKDIDELIAWLETYPRLTKGPTTVEFEEKWSNWLGVKHSTFVNSGSSAILMALQALICAGTIQPGDSVVVPSLSWATDYSSVVQLGLNPILCDCNMEDLSVDIDHLEKIIRSFSPKVLLLVSVLGLVPDMERIVDICFKNNVTLIEDVCESIGSKFEDKNLGTYGLISVFSTYFGHHISTIEGGMVCTSDDAINSILKCIRNHGWSRDLPEEEQKQLQDSHNIKDFDALYTFYYLGFNFRSTDLQAYLGINQLDKLNEICLQRLKNFERYLFYMDRTNIYWVPEIRTDCTISNFAFPLVMPKPILRDIVVRNLARNDIQVRPLICGSITKQPFYKATEHYQSTPNADTIHDCGMYLPNHAYMTEEDIQKIARVIHSTIGNYNE